MKIKKKIWGGGGGGLRGSGWGGVRVDVNEKLKFLGNWGVVRGGGMNFF